MTKHNNSESGLLTIGANASKQKITVRATAANGVYASKTIDVDAVDTSTDTYDTLTCQLIKQQ